MAIPSKLKAVVGKSTRATLHEIEKGQIRRFARGIGETNIIHFDEKAAKAGGFTSLVAPPTFAAALHDLEPLYEMAGIDQQGTMHAEEEYEYFRPICAGDEISVVHKIVDAYDKNAPNGRLRFIVIESKGTDRRSRKVFKGRRVLVELKS